MNEPWFTPVDPLGEALHFLRMSGTFYCRSEMRAPWAVEVPPFPGCLMFHAVMSGHCRLAVAGAEPLWLEAGDFVLVPHGAGHVLASDEHVPAPKLFDLPREQVSERYEVLRLGVPGGAPTHVVCGLVRFDRPAAQRLVALLPRTLPLRARSAGESDWVGSTVRVMAAEAEALHPGGEAVITRLADVLVIQTIRSWIAHDPAAQTGWLGALKDKQIGRALALIHRDPARAWTVAALAAEVAMSRSAFAARFTTLVGEPAMHYVARWRMNVAHDALKEEGAAIGDLAARLGYQSEAAFSRSFKRFTGESPGAVRRGARAVGAAATG